ncbi:hypothetical protein [Sphingomonas sp. LaA6.9]|uniref:hypothetical protein n=1 Tax=Sphingomonas sp. LaA6.9 TaxID=2919914 RepID=UPI001F4F4233|nr:hypothetical protein [Sphingomonas sp. LaA6.9]MCJ8156709.1 hypothetical protein [Sphingomonas sp. LaA6.9]
MSEISTPIVPEGKPTPAQQLTELRAIQALVNELAGACLPTPFATADVAFDTRYDSAPPLVQRRFDAVAGETAAYAAAGLTALIAGRKQGAGATAAAAHLAREMEKSIRAMEKILA